MALTTIKTAAIADDAVTTDKLANAINTERTANTAKDLTALSASNLTSGTVPDARFPATLPAASAANLTAVPAANITGTLPAISAANLTNVPAANITGTLPAISGANLTNLPASGRADNRIINGACEVAQRGTSSSSNGYGSVDRMQLSVTNTDQLAWLQKQSDDAPDGFCKSWEFDVTSTESSIDADEIVYMRYLVEAQDIKSFYNANGTGKNFTLSFYVKSSNTGTFNIGIHKSDGGTRFITNTYTISAANTWQRVVWNITGDTGTTGMAFDTGQGFQISFMMTAGTNYTSGGVQTSWGGFSNSLMAGGHAVNVLDSTNNYWKITGIQLELGDTVSDFAHETYAETLRKCQRYYWKIAQNTFRRVNGYKRGDSQSYWELQCPVPMRTSPSPTLLASGTFTDFQSNFNTTQSGPNVNEWNQDTGWGLLYVSSNWSGSHDSIHSWEGYSIEFSAEL
mgnify:CR=1 FL=1